VLLKTEPRISAKRIGRILETETGRLGARTVRKYVAELRDRLFAKEAFVHRTPLPGDAAEVDFGESWAEIAGCRQKAKYIVVTLPACNAYFAKAYPIERLECLLDGMSEAFEWFGGVPRRGVLDNTALAVRKVLKGTDRVETNRFHAFRGEWVLHVDFCAPAKGWEKGSVERGVEYVRGLVFRPMPKVESFDELNARILVVLDHDLDLRKLPDGRTARQALVAEREHLRPLPVHRPETCRVLACVANKYAHVRIDRVTYSLPSEHARRVVTCKLFHDRVEMARDGEVIARHARSYRAGSIVIDPLHTLRLLERKHRAVGEATAITQWELPMAFHELREKLRGEVRKPDQEWVGVLRLIEKHSMGDVESAVQRALERGSPRLSTVHLLLRQESEEHQRPVPIEIEREELAMLEVAAPELSAWDVLCEGGAR
jgi:transposase